MSTPLRGMMLALPLLSILAACKPEPPKPADAPPAPQATALRTAIAQPLDRAKQAQATVERAAAAQNAAIDAATAQ
ncbi:hypothetical protein [Xanthomonas albilineans]|uniref:Hypothetical lipoprotein n=1 Tax=Xanthomonas albilineans (strain GPE PC73 / CFBP 7063) TaxID=380358 RepID=D2UG35_XANAP|nr:hypothetical protein [Xanthomonas albilineans]QHQ29598.1 putative lipoprotein [Xanthomonas albilineans]CBA17346.1 hypothetical lipoprotein [Xanthomonas albilineans GPE PC73]